MYSVFDIPYTSSVLFLPETHGQVKGSDQSPAQASPALKSGSGGRRYGFPIPDPLSDGEKTHKSPSNYHLLKGKTIVSMIESPSGNAKEIYVWGKIEALIVAVHVFNQLVEGELDFETVVNSLDNGSKYTLGGFKMTYDSPEKDMYVFKIVGA